MSSHALDLRFRRIGRGTFAGGLLITLAVHGLLGVLVWWAHVGSPPPPEAPRDLMVAKMVTLGKPREKFWLPKKAVQPKPQAPPPTIKVTENETAAPAPKEAPRPEDPEVSKDLKRALERARKLAAASAEEPPEGLPTGSAAGTATEASAGDAYATAIYEAIRRNWTVPTGLSLGAASALETDVIVTISDDGRLGTPRIKKSSGNELFDASCMEAIQATRDVPPPPPSERAKYRRGVVLQFEGKDLAR